MKKTWFLIVIFSLLTVSISYAWLVEDFNDPSTFSRAIGGGIYPLYEGAQSVGYNPAGIADGNSEVYFSHTEHFLGVIRNEFLSASMQFGNFAVGSAVQYTYPTDMLNYYQYKFIVSAAYRFGKNSIGVELNKWKGSEIKDGQSFDAGALINFSNLNVGLVIKNLFASISWPSANESYNPELVLSAAYFTNLYTLSSYANFTAKSAGVGIIWPLTNSLDIMAGWKSNYGVNASNELSTGLRISYYNFILDMCYSFKDSLNVADTISPFYISLTYDMMKGM